MRGRALRLPPRFVAASVLFLGVPLGASVPFVLAHLTATTSHRRSGSVDGRAFEGLGPQAFKARAVTFVAVCAAEVVAGVALGFALGWGTAYP